MPQELPSISILPGSYTVHRLNPTRSAPELTSQQDFLAFVRTADELSIVCNSRQEIASEKRETGWALLKVEGPLDFSLVGILANLTKILADAGISIFAISTFETDYLLLKEKRLQEGVQALVKAGYHTRQL